MPAAPRPDEESAPFWRSLAGHRIELQCCGSCGRRRLPPMPSCPYCGALGAEVVEVAGTGVVYSWVRVQRALTAEMEDQVPYCIAAVDLDGGGRVFGRLADPSSAGIGVRVRPAFVDHDDWTELRFEVTDGGTGPAAGREGTGRAAGREGTGQGATR